MKLLYIPSCGFGDVSFSTTWPKIFVGRGHIVDVFLMVYTGNPFHANPYVRNMFLADYPEAANKIKSVLDSHSYDMVLLPITT